MCQCELISTRTGLFVIFLISAITIRDVDVRALLSNTTTSLSLTTTSEFDDVHKSRVDGARKRKMPGPSSTRSSAIESRVTHLVPGLSRGPRTRQAQPSRL